jgi:hypothetical protein
MSVPRPAMLVAMVIAPGGRPGDDLRLALVLLGVEHFVRHAGLAQVLGQQLGGFDRRGAHQHRLAALGSP